ncbi:hypothetical protein BU14_0483s0018 [Porphyra umbilicalis]|uniref:Uncharacterized protein n=1 Tax=Porphyra umbilicalis TaxID=2786 RepID=A0A1X6NU18_PORUM|nr:hypothetical protein BU14_0483s0018 [Porphyra umbilicalis]|eukprot:OSX72006.1 hypothetical protein BU14_0483s0018 [Porphyra umbilicalis]
MASRLNKSSGYPAARKSFVGHLLPRSPGQAPRSSRAWIQGVVVWFSDTAIAVDDGTGVGIVTLTDKRWLPPDPQFTPALGLYVGAVGALKAAPADGGRYVHMAGWRVLDLHDVALADELWVAEVIDIHLSAQSANGAT